MKISNSNIYFKNHPIQNTTRTTFYNDKIFYFYNTSILSYSLSNDSTSKIAILKNSHFLTNYKGTLLYSLFNNTLSIINTKNNLINEIILKLIPLQIIEDNNFIGFVYNNSIELLKKSNNQLTELNLPWNIKSISCFGEYSYFLTQNNEILRSKNIFLTQFLTIPVRIKTNQKLEEDLCKIYFYKNNIFIKSIKRILKYKIDKDLLIFEYSIISDINDEIIEGYLLGKNLIHLSRAPIRILNERVYNIFSNNSDNNDTNFNNTDNNINNSDYTFNNNGGIMALTDARIYFINNFLFNSKKLNNINSFEIYKNEFSINPNSIIIPDCIKDQKQKDQFLKNQLLLKKYEILMENIRKIDTNLEIREYENSKEYNQIIDKLNLLNNKIEGIEKRVKKIREKAEKVVLKGNTEGFYDKLNILNNKLESLEKRGKLEELREFKRQLKAQNVILKEKL